MYEYVGNIHVHSTYSDGTGTVEEIAAAAEKAGLDFVIITDHEAHKGSLEKKGWYGDTLVLMDTELNRDDHHYLAFNLKEEISTQGLTPQEVINRVSQMGGFGVIAHPYEKGSPIILKGKHYPWRDWEVKDFMGIEIWNYTSLCRDAATSALKALWLYYFAHGAAARHPCPCSLKKWDELLARGLRVLALGGTDAHAIRCRWKGLKMTIFPYEYLFKTINTHVLLHEELSGEERYDSQLIYQALKYGHYHTSNDRNLSSTGFRFTADNEGRRVISGDTLSLDKETVLEVKSPTSRSLIRMIKDGQVISESQKNHLMLKVLEKGAFRVEVYSRPLIGKPRPWIYSNPIFIE